MNTASNNPSSSSPPLYRRRWFITLLVLTLLFFVILLLLPVGIGYGVKSWMLGQGAEEVQIEDVDFNPFTGTLALRGLQVSANGNRTLELPFLSVVTDWMPLWRRQAYVRTLELQGLRLSVADTEGEGLQIGGIRLAGGPEDEPEDAPEEGVPWGFGIGRLLISDSEVGYRDPRLETRVSLQRLQLSELISWKPEQAVDLALAGAIDQAPLQIDGQLTPFSANPEFNGKVQLEDLVLGTFSGLAGPQLRQLAGKLSIDSSLQARQQQDGTMQAQQQGKIRLQGLQIASDPLQLDQQQLGWDGKTVLDLAPDANRVTLDLDGRLEQGPLALKFAEPGLQVQDQGLSWQGAVNLKQQSESYQLAIKGGLEHKALDLALSETGMRLKNGQLNWSGELSVEGEPQTTKVQTGGELKLSQLRIDPGEVAQTVTAQRIEIASSQLQFQQDKGSGAVDLSHQGKLSISGLGANQAGDNLSEQGIQWQGDLALNSVGDKLRLDAQGELQTEQLAVLLSVWDLDLKQGPLRWNGSARYGQSDGELLLELKGDFAAGQLLVDAPKHDIRLLAFDSLRLDGIDLKGPKAFDLQQASTENLRLARRDNAETAGAEAAPALLQTSRSSLTGVRFGMPSGLHIEQLEHQDLHAIIRRDKEGGLNAVRIIDILTEILAGEVKTDTAEDVSVEQEGLSSEAEPAVAESGGLPVRVGKVVVTGESTLLYADDNVDPPYLARLEFTEFSLSDIDSGDPEQDSLFVLKAKIGEHAELNLEGKARFFDKQGTADIKGRIEALELPPLSSYSGPAIGYRLQSGQLDADIDIQIKQGQISGSNHLAIHQLEVAKLDAEQLKKYEIQTTVPLDTGLDMLRDRNNTINLELPVAGDISQPEFNINDALNQAIGKAMQKGARVYLAAALFPFGTMLAVAEIAGGAAMQVRLDPVVFAEASTELDKTSKEYLEKIAEVLKERPAIYIKVCGVVVDGDREALKQKNSVESKTKGEAAGEVGRQLISPREAEQPAQKQDAAESKIKENPQPAIVSSAQLKALAAERAAGVKGYLMKQGGVKAGRLIACEPAIDLEKPAAKPRVDLLL